MGGFEDILQSYVRSAVSVNSPYQNTKWLLNEMLTGGSTVLPPTEVRGVKLKDFKHRLGQSKNVATICEMCGVPYDAGMYPGSAHMTTFYRNYNFADTQSSNGQAVSQK